MPTVEPINEPTTEPTSSQPPEPNLTPNQVPLFLDATYELDPIETLDWFNLDKASILDLFGDDYGLIASGYQQGVSLYAYKNGLGFAFDEDQKLAYLECEDTVVSSITHGKMSFKQIMYLITPVDIMNFQDDGIIYYYIDIETRGLVYRYIS